MSTYSPILGILLMVQAQNGKYLTSNNGVGALEAAANAVTQIAMADASQTLTAAQATGFFVFQCQGALTADRSLILPNVFRYCLVHNLTTGGHNIVVSTASPRRTVLVPIAEDIITSSGGTVFATKGTQLVYCDGQNNFWAV